MSQLFSQHGPLITVHWPPICYWFKADFIDLKTHLFPSPPEHQRAEFGEQTRWHVFNEDFNGDIFQALNPDQKVKQCWNHKE